MQRNLGSANGGPPGRRQASNDLGGSSWNGGGPTFSTGSILRNGIGQDFIPGLGSTQARSSRMNAAPGAATGASSRQRSVADQQHRQGRRDSNSSAGTFATQVPNTEAPRMSTRSTMSNTLAVYQNSPQDSMSGMGVGFQNMRIADYHPNAPQSRALQTVQEGNSRDGMNVTSRSSSGNSRNDSIVSGTAGSTHRLVQMIKAGETEDPFDRSMSRYDTPSKLPNPTMGPARFKESKMFSKADGANIDNADASRAGQVQRRAIMPAQANRVPDWLNLAQQGLMRPTVEEAGDALPIVELCGTVGPSPAGVLRVKDIPYGTTRAEMTAFVGRNAQILRQPEGSPYHAIHIIMERESGKTMDCFIEVSTPSEAAWVARQFGRRVESRRAPKVGDRSVEVVYSTQDELMAELFPRAKHVRWSEGQPVVDTTPRQYYKGQVAAGFQGFIHTEELVAMGKHANLSERSPFASKSPCRVYEGMISLLHKYPWYDTERVTILERRNIFDCATNLIKTLVIELRRGTSKPYDPLLPTSALLQELSVAALTCPGFSEKQKASIVGQLLQGGFKSMAEGHGINVKLGGSHEFSAFWPFSALSMKPDVDGSLLKYYAGLFREANPMPHMSLAQRQASKAAGQDDKPMGNISIDYGQNPTKLSLKEVAIVEYNAIEKMLVRICSTPAPLQSGFGGQAAIGGPRGRNGSGGSGSSSGRNGQGGAGRQYDF